jgi:type II secretory pathway pseudopilin PulG
MGWAIVSVLGFLAATALVIWLARSNTARWEARHRAAQAVIRAREEASLRARAAALGSPESGRRPHLHLPHVHLPPGVVARLPHPHLPHLDGRLTWRLPYLSRHRRMDPAPPVEEQETPTVSPS